MRVVAVVIAVVTAAVFWLVVLVGAVVLLFLFAAGVAHGAPQRTWSQAQVIAIVRQAFPDDSERALCISDHESDGTPRHWNPAGMNGSNTGLFQIDQRTWNPARNPRALPVVGAISWARMLEPAYNAMVARRIYLYERRGGNNPWFPWSTRGLCGA